MSFTLAFEDGDIKLDSRGRVQTLSGLEKVSQEVMGALLLRFDPPRMLVGSDFSGLVDRMTARARMTALAAKELMDAVQRLREVQTAQSPALPDEEVIEGVEDVHIEQVELGVLDVSFRVVVRSGQSRKVNTELILNSVTTDLLEK